MSVSFPGSPHEDIIPFECRPATPCPPKWRPGIASRRCKVEPPAIHEMNTSSRATSPVDARRGDAGYWNACPCGTSQCCLRCFERAWTKRYTMSAKMRMAAE